MPILATSKVAGDYGVPGVGTFKGFETKEVPMDVAAWLKTRTDEFELRVEEPVDLPFRDEAGKVRQLGFFGPVDSRFGYGGGGITILRALTRLGIEVAVHPYYNYGYETAYTTDLPPDAACQLGHRRFIPKWELAQCLPDDYVRSAAHGGSAHRVAWTMWETDRIPDGSKYRKALPFGNWAELINQNADRLVVPCHHNKRVFAECGVTLPIDVIPYGLDTDVWPHVDRPARDTC